jgi:hypothetical protein
MLFVPAFAAALALFTFWLHTFVGHHVVLVPAARDVREPFAKATMEVCWHFTSHMLAMQTLLLGIAAIPGSHSFALLVIVASSAIPFAFIFLYTSQRYFKNLLTLPQSLLLGPIGLLAFLAIFQPVALPQKMVLAILLCILTFIIAAIHIAWAFGSTWPVRSREDLVELVVGQTREHPFPSRNACLAVALCFVLVTGFFGHAASSHSESAWSELGTYIIASVFVVRGLGGFAERFLRPSVRNLPYDHWNRVLYSPLCLVLAALTLATVI